MLRLKQFFKNNECRDQEVLVQFYVSSRILNDFDRAARRAGYATRSEALRALIREFIKRSS